MPRRRAHAAAISALSRTRRRACQTATGLYKCCVVWSASVCGLPEPPLGILARIQRRADRGPVRHGPGFFCPIPRESVYDPRTSDVCGLRGDCVDLDRNALGYPLKGPGDPRTRGDSLPLRPQSGRARGYHPGTLARRGVFPRRRPCCRRSFKRCPCLIRARAGARIPDRGNGWGHEFPGCRPRLARGQMRRRTRPRCRRGGVGAGRDVFRAEATARVLDPSTAHARQIGLDRRTCQRVALVGDGADWIWRDGPTYLGGP